MNIPAKSVIEMKVNSFSEPPPHQPPAPGYKVCFYRTPASVGDDTFVGEIVGIRFDGNHLTLWLSPFTRAIQLDRINNLVNSWKCLAPITSIQLEFDGCKMIAEESDTEKVTFKSSTDETIILSNGIKDIREIEELFYPA